MKFLKQILDTYKKGLSYDSMVVVNKELVKEQEQFKQCIFDLEKELILVHSDLEECSQTQIEPILDTFNLERSISILEKTIEPGAFKYAIRGDGNKVDMKYALTYKYDSIVKMYAERVRREYKPTTPTECVEAVMRWFIYKQPPKYVRDEVQFGKRDYWAKADDFLMKWEGDCEDTAISMHVIIKSLLELQGFGEHYDRLYLSVNLNWVEPHANNLWLADDGYFYTIESTIDAKGTFKRKWLNVPLKYDAFYTKILGIANLNGSHKGSNAILKQFI